MELNTSLLSNYLYSSWLPINKNIEFIYIERDHSFTLSTLEFSNILQNNIGKNIVIINMTRNCNDFIGDNYLLTI